jgi:hypothetical protein
MKTKKPYTIVRDDEVNYMLRNFEGDFDAAMRRRLPTLKDAERIQPLEKEPWRFDVELDADDDRTWQVVSYLETQHNRLVVLGAYPKMIEPPECSREEALAFIDAGMGKGQEGMTGGEYVDSIRYIWEGLQPRDKRDT